ncbi:S8 family serine peptidase [Dehalococcoidales bacterium]|nr:S8 family serine peptidase [Dehalococcoidales bacterium]
MKKVWLGITSIVMCFLLMGSGMWGALALAEEHPPSDLREQIPKDIQDLEPKIDSLLEAEIKARPEEKIPIIIMLKEPNVEITLPPEAEDVRHLGIINAIAATVPAGEIAAIANLPEVKMVYLDEKIELIEPMVGPPAEVTDYGDGIIGAPDLWEGNITGAGIRIAILDTGIDKYHPDLEGKVIAERDFTWGPPDWRRQGTITAAVTDSYTLPFKDTDYVYITLWWEDPLNDLELKFVGPETETYIGADPEGWGRNKRIEITTRIADGDWTISVTGTTVTGTESYYLSLHYHSPWDGHGHGTHVAGIAAGDPGTTDNITVSGVAPEASLINAKVLNREGRGLTSWIIAGIEWSMLQEAHILNLSLGYRQWDGTGRDPLSLAVTAAVEAGHVVVCGAGNLGPGEATIMSPAVAYGAIAVAASTIKDTIATDIPIDAIAFWSSSRGPAGDGRIGIDLAAPGVGIIAPVPPHVDLDGDGYEAWSGTSMSAPHVAGAAALLLQALLLQEHRLTPGEIEMALKNSAFDIDACILEQGAGRLDVKAAHDALLGGILVNHEWFVGRVLPADYTQTFTVINNSTKEVTLSLTETVMTDTQGVVAGDWLTAPEKVTVPAGPNAIFEFGVTMSVPPETVGTYIGSITLSSEEPLTHITIPISVNVMQLVEATTVTDLIGTVDEREAIYYTLDVEPGLVKLDLRLDWTDPDNKLGLLLFNPDGELTKGWWYWWWEPITEIEVALPQAGKWTVVIAAWWLETPEETYTLRVGALYLELGPGWNIMSTPVALDPDIDTWGEFIALGDGLAVKLAYYFDSLNQEWDPVLADYELKAVDAIYVKMKEADTAPIVPSPDVSVPAKELHTGWNLVGLAALERMEVDRALATVYLVPGDLTGYSLVVSPPLNQPPWIYIRDEEVHEQFMKVGKGYWVFMINPGTLAGFIFTPITP